MKIFDAEGKTEYIVKAQKAFENSLKEVRYVDMALKVWSGFLYYNLGRSYMKQNMVEDADKCFLKAIIIRKSWMKISYLQ